MTSLNKKVPTMNNNLSRARSNLGGHMADYNDLKEKCFPYRGLKTSNVAKQFSKKGILNPAFLQDIFKHMDENRYESTMLVEKSSTKDIMEVSTTTTTSTQTSPPEKWK
ncbi:hypothetical protein ACF0H5_009399 [Mactra antiquata]